MTPKNPSSTDSIGMFDSGLGGLTVMQQLIRVAPKESIIYFGDTARLPYGEKSQETIIRYSIENSLFLIKKNVKMIVVACSTATAQALDKLQQTFSLPVIGAIEPGAAHAVKLSKSGRIAVLGTRGTILSQAYQKTILKLNPHAHVVPIACPLFVPLVEEQFAQHEAARLIVQEYLRPLKQQQVDTLILGCTHYPLLRQLISAEIGEGIAIVDSAAACAEKIALSLHENSLSRHHDHDIFHHYYVSDDPKKFQALGRKFLGMPIEHVELV